MNYLINKITRYLLNKSKRYQEESELKDLSLWDLEINKLGHISVAGFDTLDLTKRFGSPLLIINQKKLENDAVEILKALNQAIPGSKVLYSYKTNCIPGLLSRIHQLGIGAEVVSPYELWLAKKMGVPGNLIIYNGVNKTDESLKMGIDMDILAINIDHQEEITRLYRIARELNRKVSVGIRLGMISKSQFGLDDGNGEAFEVCKQIAKLNDFLDLHCVHFNVISNAKTAFFHKTCTLRALDFIKKLKLELGIKVSYLDIGGGFGVPTTKNMSGYEYGLYRTLGLLPKPPLLSDFQPIHSFISEIAESIRDYCQDSNLEKPKILIEPGRFITSMCEFLLATVLTVKNKRNGTKFAITDAGRLSITFPCDFEYHEIFLSDRPYERRSTNYQIVGRICTSADWMFKNRYLPELRPGDVLAVMDAGAYFSSYSSNFSFPRPAIVMVANGEANVIRREETFEHLTAMDLF